MSNEVGAINGDDGDGDIMVLEGVTSMTELESIVSATLDKLNFGESCNPTKLTNKVKGLERKHQEVNRIFDVCDELLEKYYKECTALQEQSVSIQETIICKSDSDDDIELIDFKPSEKVQFGDSLRCQQSSSSQVLYKTSMGIDGIKVKALMCSEPRQIMPLPVSTTLKTMQVAIGMKLFAKKVNEIWYRGTLIDIIGKSEQQTNLKYRVKFDGKGVKAVSGMHLAFYDYPKEIMPVGSRIIALYKDEDSNQAYYAGIVAEPPSVRNGHRYLVFFDDGYAQYCNGRDIHKVFLQSKNVWEDIHPDSQDFIKGYLQQYPERPMVRLQKGQFVKTEWNGHWWVAHVQEVDASLVKMYFEADQRVEWIYRGSTRLEPLYTELANAEASKLAGKGRRHNVNLKNQRKPIVEYTRGTDKGLAADDKKLTSETVTSSPITGNVPAVHDSHKRRAVARKSTSNKNRNAGSPHNAGSQWWASKTPAMPLPVGKERMTEVIDLDSEDALGDTVEIVKIVPKRDRRAFVSHLCGNHCIKELEVDIDKLKGNNPLLFPQLCGWERQITKQKNTGKLVVFYRAPCGRRMRDTEETDYFLMMTGSNLTIDYFCFDSRLRTDTEYVPVKTFCDIKDLSYGKETVPISCVNGIDRQYPDYVEYSNQRIPAKGVKLNLDEQFLSGCSCTDGCRDHTKCECIQLTYAATKIIPNLAKDSPDEVGYEFRRLKEPMLSGIYECNSRCKCDHRCLNRVAQNGLQLRLQVFKTEKRGWGLRCLDDIPEGGFICVYAGQLLTEQGANEDGQQYGDEYLAELDYIEVVERIKEGYESDVVEDEAIPAESDEDYKTEETDSTYSGERRYRKHNPTDSTKQCTEKQELTGKQKTEEWLEKMPSDAIVVSDEEASKLKQKQQKNSGNGDDDSAESQSDILPDIYSGSKTSSNGKTSTSASLKEDNGELKITEPTSLNTDNVETEDTDEEVMARKKKVSSGQLRRSTRSTSGMSRFRNLPDPKSQKPVSPLKINLSSMQVTKKEEVKEKHHKRKSTLHTRQFFGEDFCYVMDAKSMGNLGRYLNHSCTPNAFVQNVFVDTHDLRFPWVAFFAHTYISAGTELTWDYNYEVGSVPGKVLYCYCGSAECRGRLL
ncbi:hypothetical protein LSH36_15g13047 [Paralvinella palmiformis]|uniref:Histone-lysine N-methyltransferase eggless n=1 Tax=Paralvinella palmiformis TaxID=53620 RepID=A0AAD9KCM5_9ANNE|nr:hypothetical protein LSH36_15g13047 [Paralvinella palmiformis]